MELEKQSTHQVRMLGPFAAKVEGVPIPRHAWGRQKSLSIAKFLLIHRGEAVSIERLAELFYPDTGVGRIHANVRGRISEIRKALWPDRTDTDGRNGLQLVSKSSYRFDPQAPFWIDVEWFERYLASADDYMRREMWQAALEDFGHANALYQGDFLVDDLDQPWTYDIRERLRLAFQSSLIHTAECHLHLGQYLQAAASARRAQEIDPLDEEAYRLQIEALGQIPDKSAALNVYKELANALEEISVEPDPDIKRLIDRIQRGALKVTTRGQRHNLRQQLTTFLGREHELDALKERLTDSKTRVVTLLGPGGIGKTRLAVEAGQQLTSSFQDGVYFISVPEYKNAPALAAGIAQVLGFSVNRPNSSVREICDYLSNKDMLLIIDAAEHAQDSAPLFDPLLRSSQVKLLFTSRRRLHLPGEFIIDITGLPYPMEPPNLTHIDGAISPKASPAFRLFVDRYVRVRPRFHQSDEERAAIARVCRMVEGMPLAIEMAASWGRVLSCQEIAERVASFESFADTLEGQSQGMGRVFSFSWQMLTDVEKLAALRLSTFASSFERNAAEYVANCPASLVMSLCDKSFVQWEPQGRFRIHEVIRRYLLRELAVDPDAEVIAHQVHADYFAKRLGGGDRTNALDLDQVEELVHDLPNIQQAWRWWVGQFDVETLQGTLRPLVQLHETFDQFSTLVDLLETAIAHTRDRLGGGLTDQSECEQTEEGLCATFLTQLGYISMRTGDLQRAEIALSEAGALLEKIHADDCKTQAHTAAMYRMVSGWLSLDRGDFEGARAQLTSAAQELKALGDEWHRAGAISLLATQARTSGEFDQSRQLYQECLAIHERLGDTRAIAGVMSNLGAVFGNLQQYDESERYFKEARRYAEEGGHRLLMFFALGNSAFLAYKRSLLDEAESLCREALDMAVDLGLKSGQANIAYYLALIALDRHEGQRALPYLQQALEQSLNAQALQLTLQAMHGFARYLAISGAGEDAAALLEFVINQPAYPQPARTRSQEVLATLTSTLSDREIARASRKAQEKTIDDFIAQLRLTAHSQADNRAVISERTR